MQRKPFSLTVPRWIEIGVGDKFYSESGKFRYYVRDVDELGVTCIDLNEMIDPALPLDIRYYTIHCLPHPYWKDKEIRDGQIRRLRGDMKGQIKHKRPPFRLNLPRRELRGEFLQAQVDFEWPKPEPFEVDEDFKNMTQVGLFEEYEHGKASQTDIDDYENDFKIRHLDWGQ